MSDMRAERLASAGRLCDEAADELELAAQHARVAATHYRDGEIARAAAHAWATRGHVLNAQQRLDDQARTHAGTSRLPD